MNAETTDEDCTRIRRQENKAMEHEHVQEEEVDHDLRPNYNLDTTAAQTAPIDKI